MFKSVYLRWLCIILAIGVGIAIIVSFACLGNVKIKFKSDYYFIYYRVSDNALSVNGLSSSYADFGGAGYVLEYKGNFYVTLACYFNEDDAKKVCEELKKDVDCSILSVNVRYFKVKNRDRKNSLLYLGNLNTLNAICNIFYSLANRLDIGDIGQDKAKEIVLEAKKSLGQLLKNNENNTFTHKIKYLITLCNSLPTKLMSGNLRYVQIAIIDCMLNN